MSYVCLCGSSECAMYGCLRYRSMDTGSQKPSTMHPIGGWVCGKCGASNAPFVSQCPCSLKESVV